MLEEKRGSKRDGLVQNAQKELRRKTSARIRSEKW